MDETSMIETERSRAGYVTLLDGSRVPRKWKCPDCQHPRGDAINAQLADGSYGYTGTVRCRQCNRVSALSQAIGNKESGDE